jgi:hypothetical protein
MGLSGIVELMPVRLAAGGEAADRDGTHGMGVPAPAPRGWRLIVKSVLAARLRDVGGGILVG